MPELRFVMMRGTEPAFWLLGRGELTARGFRPLAGLPAGFYTWRRMFAIELTDWLLLGSLVPLLMGSAFFSGTETALFSLSAGQRQELISRGGMIARALEGLLSHTRALLLTILIGNMTINVLFFVISTVLLIRLNEVYRLPGVWLTPLSVLPLFLIVMLGEVIPKLVASRNTVTFARLVTLPLHGVHRLLAPLRVSLNLLVVTPLARLIEPSRRPEAFSPRELEMLLKVSKQQGIIDPDEEGMMQAIVSMSQLRVRHIMTPRVEIRAFDLEGDLEKLEDLIRHTRLSRIPVYRGDMDHIVGMVLSRDVLLAPPSNLAELEAMVLGVEYVPELVRLNQLPEVFSRTRQPLVIVVDEFGGTAGLVTLEDLMEHVVGDIAGPYDAIANTTIEKLDEHRYRLGAGFPLEQLSDLLDIDRSVLDQMPRTLAGWVMMKLGRLPEEGDCLALPSVRVTVEQMAHRRITTLMLELGAGAGSATGAGAGGAQPGGTQPGGAVRGGRLPAAHLDESETRESDRPGRGGGA